MADLNELLSQARAQRVKSDETARALAIESGRLAALREQADNLSRRVDPKNTEQVKQLEALLATIRQSSARIDQLKSDKRASIDDWTRISGLLEPVVDPRTAITGLDASYPILLFPLRLETRFADAAGRAGNTKQLLVRVYPDDCSIDSFEADLSESEVTNARRYWCNIWSAGGDEGRERAAWRELCAAQGAGRAMYLIQQYAPLADSDPRPVRAKSSDIILAIPADAALANASEKSALTTYWNAAFRAGSNATSAANAFQALSTAVGAARADVLRQTYVPFNVQEKLQAGSDRATVAVSTVFVRLTPVATAAVKHQAWTRPPQAALLPERFLLIGDSGAEHVEVLGGIVIQPLAAGPDPLADQTDQFKADNGDVNVPAPLKWMTDFEAALQAGMAFRVNLTARQASQGFDRLYVLGLRLATDPDTSRTDFEQLLQHHANGQNGFAVVPQGTPTNNDETGSSGWTRVQEADDLFPLSRQTGTKQFDDTATAPYDKADGLVLAEALGIDPAMLETIPNADGKDQAHGRAMNAALWPANLGYWMDTQLLPVFSPMAIARTRQFFIDRVTGRGPVPAVRIGKQPYGILATTAFSRMNWMETGQQLPSLVGSSDSFLMVLRDVLRALGTKYWDGLAANVPRVGKQSLNPQQQLLDIVGLNPSSVEFHLEILDSADRIWNQYKLGSRARTTLESAMKGAMQATSQALRDLGYTGGTDPEIVNKFFSYVAGPMTRPAVDTAALSETAELPPCTVDGKNYITWCREKAQTAFEDLRLERGFANGKTPDALLYHMLQHGLQLGYYSSAVDLHLAQNLLPAGFLETNREPAFVHVAETTGSESRYGLLYAAQPAITGSPTLTVAQFIPAWLGGGGNSGVLAAQIEALGVLEHCSTAELERAFAEHVDLCSYRWDAWMLSLVNEQLHRMRSAQPRGLYLGAFGWVEGLKPESGHLSSVELPAEESKIFNRPGDAPLFHDSANEGYAMAPSLNHAATAAVLRNGYVANATPTQPDLLAVDLSSARVRVALQFMEGVRNGQPLGALLGYQFEKRLHDRHNEAEVDVYIYEIRKAFPLASKRILETADASAENASIQSVEARNVCDGLLLLEFVRTSAVKTYPWGKPLLAANSTQQGIIDEEVQGLFEIQDAISDVTIAEAVHQVMVGNPDRAAAAMDSASKGTFPPQPDVVRTPRSGIALTHRVGLHLPVDAAVAAGATPRAAAEPALDRWLETVFPPLANIVVQVEIDGRPSVDVSMSDLGLRPVDLLYLLNFTSDQAMGELDSRILQHTIATAGLAPDTGIHIRYTAPGGLKESAFEIGPLAASLRSLLLTARPLRPSDAAMPNEADATADSAVAVPQTQVDSASNSVAQVHTDALSLLAALNPVVQPAAPFATVVGAIDGLCTAFVDLQHRAGLCGVSLASPGSILRARLDWFQFVRAAAKKVSDRWTDKLAAADSLLADAVNPANSDLMKIDAIERAEREISTAFTDPIPATPAAFLAIVTPKRNTFAAALAGIQAVRTSAATDIQTLWNAWDATFPGRPALNLTADDSSAEQAQVRSLADLMQSLTTSLKTELEQRIATANTLLSEASTAGGDRKVQLQADAVKALLGDGVRVIPRFTLSADQGDEWQNAFDGRANLLTGLTATHDFPVDDWMYGVARVRGKMHDWENVVQLTGAFGTTEPVLMPVQFPFSAGEPWFAMELPAAFDITKAGEHLLYTAAYASGGFDKTATHFGGLLLDEWTEVIPGTRETAGLAFHYNRPSNEPPQTMLLVTPATAGAKWTWEDLRSAIPETFALAEKRAVEPRDISATPLSRLLPATMMAFTTNEISIGSSLRVADVIRTKGVALNG